MFLIVQRFYLQKFSSGIGWEAANFGERARKIRPERPPFVSRLSRPSAPKCIETVYCTHRPASCRAISSVRCCIRTVVWCHSLTEFEFGLCATHSIHTAHFRCGRIKAHYSLGPYARITSQSAGRQQHTSGLHTEFHAFEFLRLYFFASHRPIQRYCSLTRCLY